MNNAIFFRLPVTGAQCIIGAETYSDVGIKLCNGFNDSSVGCGLIKEVFRILTIVNNLQPCLSDHDSRVEFCDNIYVFDIRFRENFTAAQPVEVEVKFGGFVPNDIIGYALVLSNNLVCVGGDGQRHFNLI